MLSAGNFVCRRQSFARLALRPESAALEGFIGFSHALIEKTNPQPPSDILKRPEIVGGVRRFVAHLRKKYRSITPRLFSAFLFKPHKACPGIPNAFYPEFLSLSAGARQAFAREKNFCAFYGRRIILLSLRAVSYVIAKFHC